MSCQADAYYNTPVLPVVPNGGNSCGACGLGYENCGTAQNPSCCPAGFHHASEMPNGGATRCGNCFFGGVFAGKQYYCLPNEPVMTDEAKANCCTDMIPGGNPIGYCGTGWCTNSDKCASYMATTYCKGDNLQTPQCKKFCLSNLGSCDNALISYCSDPKNFKLPVCGCALPKDQYPLNKYKTPDAPAIPIMCNRECGLNDKAIRLQTQPDCTIKSICITDINDLKIVESETMPGIDITQNCGNAPPNNTPTTQPSIFQKYWYIFLIILMIIFIIIILTIAAI